MTTGMKHLAAYQANLLDYNAAKDRACNYIGNQIRAARKSMKLSLKGNASSQGKASRPHR